MINDARQTFLEILRGKIKSNEDINKQYGKKTDNGTWVLDYDKLSSYDSFNIDINNLKNEVFNPVVISQKEKDDITLEVSNRGRIRYNNRILRLVEECNNKDENNHSIKGYLQISRLEDVYKNIPDSEYKYVYQLVAKAWLLDKPTKCSKCNECQMEVHHIDNDGYNNNKDNLVYLSKCEHKEVHGIKEV